ncbi:MAG: 3-deoxy-manno-octulosonate cytidylyltransferase [Gammaproteobacteria bacterium]|nr:MAG: 3-deoxy-manno-octulosonate cytidylyltransferase [Gammaproteobacteria bacterium]
MRFKVIIPARYASTRLPGKPLRELAGKPMLQHVFERARASGAEQVIIATDDERIRRAAHAFSAEVCMTSDAHASGADRLAEAAGQLGLADDEIVVNLQGDEPLMPPALIRQAAEALAACPGVSVATVCTPINSAEELFDAHVTKVVVDSQGNALYFSRAPIPWQRAAFSRDKRELPPDGGHYRHIGLYAYRVGFLQQFVTWPVCALEQAESLEQLRVLWNGHKIHVAPACATPGPGVDTEQDLTRAHELLLAAH